MALTETDKALLLGAIGQPESANRIIQLLNEAGSSVGDFKADGTVPATGNFDLNSNRIINLAAPVNPGDAARLSSLENLVTGPASATDNALVRFDSTTGKLVQNSVAVLDDLGTLLVNRVQMPGSNILIGNGAGASLTGTGFSEVFIGNNAGTLITTANFNTFIGASAGSLATGGINNIAIGANANSGTTATRCTVVGSAAGGTTATGSNNVILGYGAGTTLTSGGTNILLGYEAQPSSPTSSNEMVVGSPNGLISTIYMGRGVTAPSLTQITLSPTSAQGTDVSAGNAFRIQGSRGTGTGTGGPIRFSVAPAGASGSTLNPVVESGSLSGLGVWTLGATGGVQDHVIRGNGLNLTRANAGEEFVLYRHESTGSLRMLGGTAAASGDFVAYGSTHATKPSYSEMRSSGTAGVAVDNNIRVTIGHVGSTQTHAIHSALETAGADALTLANGPTGTAGDPDIYLRLNINGTNYVFPGWAI